MSRWASMHSCIRRAAQLCSRLRVPQCTSATQCCLLQGVGAISADADNLLSLEREAIRFLLRDLRTRCLAAVAPALSPTDSVFYMVILERHAQRVEQVEQCQSLEQYLVIFAECIKHMKLPSHLCEVEQRRLLHSVAALATPPIESPK